MIRLCKLGENWGPRTENCFQKQGEQNPSAVPREYFARVQQPSFGCGALRKKEATSICNWLPVRVNGGKIKGNF
jgi:hypothetical protein